MKILKTLSLIGLISSVALNPASAAITGGEVATVAGVGAALIAVPPVVAQAMTYSKIDVKVEAYTETLPINRPPANTKMEWNASPDQTRNHPFKLGGPSALHALMKRAAESQELTPSTAILIAEQLAPAVGEFNRFAADCDKARSQLTSNPMLKVVWKDFDDRHRAATNIADTIVYYRSQVTEAMKDLNMDKAELSRAQENLRLLRLRLTNFPRTFATNTADLFYSQIRSVFSESAGKKLPENPSAQHNEAITSLVNSLSPPEGVSPETRMAAVVAKVFVKLKDFEDSGKRHVVANASNIELDIGTLQGRLPALLSSFGFTVELGQLTSLTSEDVVKATLPDVWLQLAGGIKADQTLQITFVGVTTGANLGPLVNEAFQGIFSKSKLIDSILREDRWRQINFAYSKSRAGDHNAIVYFDDILTPILKSATFDPSQIIAANGQLHRRVTGAMAEVFGIPVTGAHESSGALPELNLYGMKARKANGEKEAAQHREKLLTTLKELIDLYDSVQKNVEKDGWKEEKTTDPKGTKATNQLNAVKTKLADLTQKLQN